MRKKRGSTETRFRHIIGIIIPNAWDADGKATSWSIAAYNEKTYQIDMRNEIGRRVLVHAGKKIKLSGNIKKNEGKPDMIKIMEYEIIEEADA
ncbi:MAG: hypothetical protein RBT11_04960 [Desulfobacterales bacterium]|jgi:hypothetical protein|nr:hypothetical protein [Desulfobacterales bacterium]